MENKRKTNPAKMVCLIFAIIFSVILVPGLIVGIPVGGTLISASSTVSREEISSLLREKNVAGTVRDMALKEVKAEELVEEVNPEYFEKLMEDIVSVELVDGIIEEFLTSAYLGTEPQVDVSAAIEQLKAYMQEVADNGFEDLYAVWENGTSSKYFSDVFVHDFIGGVENELLSEYGGFGATSVDDLEKSYDAYYGEGKFKKLISERMNASREAWETEFNAKYESEMGNLTAELENIVNEAIYEATSNPDVREVFDVLQEINEEQETVMLVVYAVIIGAVVLLILLYWFGVAGFVVTSIPVILGGLLCKLFSLAGEPFMALVKQELANTAEDEYIAFAYDIIEGLMENLCESVSQFGTTMIIFGVILVGLAIFRGILKKNAAEAL